MFSWTKPQCPLATWEKTWTERRMRWLAQQFGLKPLREADVYGLVAELLPEPWNADRRSLDALMERLCAIFGLHPRRFELRLESSQAMDWARGVYEAGETVVTIRLQASLLRDADECVAVLAHELAHELLLGEGRLTSDVEDHEWVTDLLPLYFGLGAFATNTALEEQNTTYQWQLARRGYVPLPIYGYAWALFAWMRGEGRPAWFSGLRPDAAKIAQRGIRYLQASGDALFTPDVVHEFSQAPTADSIRQHLTSSSATRRLDALLMLYEHVDLLAPNAEHVARLLKDRDADVMATAMCALSMSEQLSARYTSDFAAGLARSNRRVVESAAYALAQPGCRAEVAVPALCQALDDTVRNDKLAEELARALTSYRGQQLPWRPIIASLLRAHRNCNFLTRDLLAYTLSGATSAADLLRDHFPDHGDEEELHDLLALLAVVPDDA